ncbi:hypothetical protein BTJ40_14465 [Microbulbifer sp. A4B17]|uniref:polymorphic toxin-type HINT domain-containing protein n=1 Tax=Microbulbifer sp. A4B17 TaxID=359370 RepID=UPI000D52C52E|nr:polymorphic toxin-type HINT domain-containing protein [Microbulbifer sp. A4B17]AWF81932.1 hypothetical protein BTJ40_14465 [Microbulbifer sp. A4B17]
MQFRKMTTRYLILLFLLFSNFCFANGGAVTFFHTDALGSPASATNAAGEILWEERYMPYGSRVDQRATDEENELWYTGKRQDSTTGLVDMGARQYDPEIARFYSTDPVGFVSDNTMSFNRYLYVNNNPYKYTDPEGEFLNNALGAFYAGTQNAAIQYAEMSLGLRSEFSYSEVALDAALGAVTSGGSGVKNTGRLVDLVKKIANGGGNGSKRGGCATCDSGCCFVAGTEILTKDGYKTIETLTIGDLVLAKDVENNIQDWKPVSQLFTKYREIYELIVVSDSGEEKRIETTDDHPFYIAGKEWVDAVELNPGDQIETDKNSTAIVKLVRLVGRTDTTYNIEVADFHTYYVTRLNLLVHNCGGNKGKGKRFKNRIPDRGEPGTVAENPAGTTRKKYGPDGNVQKEWNKGHGPKAPQNEQSDHIHDYKPNLYNPSGRGDRQPGREPRNKDLVDLEIMKPD